MRADALEDLARSEIFRFPLAQMDRDMMIIWIEWPEME